MNKLVRTLGVSILALSMSMGLAVRTVPAHAAAPVPPTTTTTGVPQCDVHVHPSSFVETGLGAQTSSVAAVITVECRPVYSEDTVTITADEINSRCRGTLSWYSPTATAGTGPGTGVGESFNVVLDNDGNAEATVWGGPSCAAGSSLITASLNAPPFATAKTTFTVVAPHNTPPGVHAYPASEVEDATTSSVETIIYVEFPSVNAEQPIKISAPELQARCAGGITWVGPDETILGTGASVFTTLDDNGNAFVVADAGPSCASGTSTIEASLTIAPFTSYTTNFTILSPRVTCSPTKCSSPTVD